MTMTTGEFNYDGIFRNAAGGIGVDAVVAIGEIAFPQISYLLWIIFIILMPILLTNLLVCQRLNRWYTCLKTGDDAYNNNTMCNPFLHLYWYGVTHGIIASSPIHV